MAAIPSGASARHALEIELREYARRLLALEAGDVATASTSFLDLETALDYLMTVVRDATDKKVAG